MPEMAINVWSDSCVAAAVDVEGRERIAKTLLHTRDMPEMAINVWSDPIYVTRRSDRSSWVMNAVWHRHAVRYGQIRRRVRLRGEI
jgi:hypothetical protein